MNALEDYKINIGKRVFKQRIRATNAPCPFKSTLRFNTVKDVVVSPYTGKPAYTFIEDESIVNCSICKLESEYQDVARAS